MIPIAGGIGIGVVWGWLMGDSRILKNPQKAAPFIIFSNSLLGVCIYFYEGWVGVVAYLVSLSVFALLHSLWRSYLSRIRIQQGRATGG